MTTRVFAKRSPRISSNSSAVLRPVARRRACSQASKGAPRGSLRVESSIGKKEVSGQTSSSTGPSLIASRMSASAMR